MKPIPYVVRFTEPAAKALGALPEEIRTTVVDLLFTVAEEPATGLALPDDRPDHLLVDFADGWVEYWIDELHMTVYVVHVHWLG